MKCRGKNKAGKRCKANAMNNGYCYRHNPEITEQEKIEVSAKGGNVKQLVITEPYNVIPLENIKDVSVFLALLINETMAGRMDLRLATGLTYISNSLIKALELSQLSDRVENLEGKIEKYVK